MRRRGAIALGQKLGLVKHPAERRHRRAHVFDALDALDDAQDLLGLELAAVAQQLALSQTSVSFGNQTVSSASAPQVVYLTDLGSSGSIPYGPTSRTQINSIMLGGTNARDFTLSENWSTN